MKFAPGKGADNEILEGVRYGWELKGVHHEEDYACAEDIRGEIIFLVRDDLWGHVPRSPAPPKEVYISAQCG